MILKDFNETFADELKDPEFAAAYLEEALEDEYPETFLVALRNVVIANGGQGQLAKKTSAGRESLYKSLSEEDNPRFKTVRSVIQALGLRFSIEQVKDATNAQKYPLSV